MRAQCPRVETAHIDIENDVSDSWHRTVPEERLANTIEAIDRVESGHAT